MRIYFTASFIYTGAHYYFRIYTFSISRLHSSYKGSLESIYKFYEIEVRLSLSSYKLETFVPDGRQKVKVIPWIRARLPSEKCYVNRSSDFDPLQ
jgi:hypothetical protein